MPKIKPVHWKELEKVFLASGFRFVRQEGSHRAYTKPGISRPVIIPAYTEVPVAEETFEVFKTSKVF
jgi:predicted RNA binding protein YcfA (HicA-like mRNA interferase family)